jgi:non-lysosomal glucosylceramidase
VTPGEGGLFVCTWPKSEHLNEGVRYRDEVWTGIEYQVAGHMVWEGLLEEAIVMVRAIHDRYDPLKHNPWNEIECGDHYARAMASWGVFTALSGYEHHGPSGHIAFAPRISPEDFRSAFTAADGWGTFSQTRDGAAQRQRIDVKWGKLRVRTLAFELAAGKTPAKVTVMTGGKPVEANHTADGNRVRIEFAGDVTLREGEALELRIA